MPALLGGPVFQGELLRSSRRRRYYFLRVAYGLVLLVLISSRFATFQRLQAIRGDMLFIRDFADFAQWTFLGFMAVQLATILLIVPPIVGGVIADEKQRKTLHYLMASRLSSGEIVLDKLAARLLHVGLFVLLGLPVLSLMNLLGGLSWQLVAVGYAEMVVTMFLTACLAVFASTIARRVRQAVLLAYMLEAAWLFVPLLVVTVMALKLQLSRGFWMHAFGSWFPLSSPLVLWSMTLEWPSRYPLAMPPEGLLDFYVKSMAIQCGLGLMLLVFSIVRLRPIFRRQEGTSARSTWFRPTHRRARWLSPPSCGDDAMLWKERYYTRTDIFTKLVVLPATVLLTVTTVLALGIDESLLRSLTDLYQWGFAGWHNVQDELNRQLRVMSPYYVGLWLLAVAGASSSSVTVERERDTWVSLTSSPLTGREILRGKMLGAVWGLRGFGALLGLFWLAGLLLGAVHPLGFLLATSVLGVLTWFVAALGTYQSLRAKWTSRALTTTLTILLGVNAGVLFLAIPIGYFVDLTWFEWKYVLSPNIASRALLSYADVSYLKDSSWEPGLFHLPNSRIGEALAGLVTLYAAGAWWLTARAMSRFDAIVDRPRLENDPNPRSGRPASRVRTEKAGAIRPEPATSWISD